MSSNDSIWEEPEVKQLTPAGTCLSGDSTKEPGVCSLDHSYTATVDNKEISQPQCFQISSTSDFVPEKKIKKTKHKKVNLHNKQTRLKNQKTQIINKYFKRFSYFCKKDKTLSLEYKKCEKNFSKISLNKQPEVEEEVRGTLLLTKWLKSAACFQPREKNYLTVEKNVFKLNKTNHKETHDWANIVHDREELDAAEALTFLSKSNFRLNETES